ncbi:MAG: hypothetical protein NC311_01570 [Muribaculaceae bacterium]|nr:hypothetical protein [Muribaculaceae bacterium]
MKKITLMLIMGLLPCGAYAARTSPSTCDSGDTPSAGYCCISYYDNGSYVERMWNCDNLDLEATTMVACKSEKTNCINYCRTYDLDNNTCSSKTVTDPCEGWQLMESEMYGTNCTIPNAKYCEYERYCDLCGNNCYNEDEEVSECIDGYYMTEDYMQCLKCPGNGVVDYDAGNLGIATCYIPRGTMTGSDATGTFKYVNDKCHYRE